MEKAGIAISVEIIIASVGPNLLIFYVRFYDAYICDSVTKLTTPH